MNAVAHPARFDRASQHRRALLAKVHIARKQLSIDEDDYRQILFDVTGRTSAADLSESQLEDVVERLKAKGFKATGKARAATHPMARKARALWISLHHLGVVNNPSEKALEAFACKQLGCERLQWARQSDAYKLIEALKAMAKRAGWHQFDPASGKKLSPLQLQTHLCQVILAKLKEAGEAPAGWELHDAMWKLCGFENARDRAWTAEDYAQLAAALGRKLRGAGGQAQ